MTSLGQFASPLTLEVQREGGAHVVWLRGSATMDQAEHLHRQLVELIEPGTADLILVLSELDFISSLGIGAIVAAHMRARTHEGGVHVVAPTEPIAKLFRLTQIDKWLPIHDSLDAARAALGSKPR